MTPVSTMCGRTVALFGLGGSGLATARALREGGATPIVWDDNPDRVQAAHVDGLLTTDLRELDWSAVATLVLAPGVPLTHPQPHWTVDLARRNGVEIIGDVELFSRERAATSPDAPLVAITGTNGKSTTTALVAHVLRELGLDVQMGGNIGVPILALEPPAPERVHVIECSSYQIDLAPSLNPTVGILLNVTPDHLDRHGTFARYAAIKERLVASSQLAIIGVDDETTRRIAAGLPNAVRISGRDHRSSIPRRDGEKVDIHVRAGVLERLATTVQPTRADERTPVEWHGTPIDISEVPSLRGPHNAQNAAAAFAAAEVVVERADPPVPGADPDYAAILHDVRTRSGKIANSFKTFPGLAHRMEEVADREGIVFVNDSKATNADATAPALGSFEKVRWIAGGLAKDGGIEPLRALFDRVEKAYLVGEAAPQFSATLGDTVPYEISGTVRAAVAHATDDARAAGGGVILFSPAAASFDQFRNFEQRGDAFRSAVEDLEN